MADEAFPSKLHQLSTEVSRRRVVAGATTLAIATSPAFSASIHGSTTMPDNVRFSNPDTMQKPPGYSHVVEVTGPGRTVYFAGQLGIDIGQDGRQCTRTNGNSIREREGGVRFCWREVRARRQA